MPLAAKTTQNGADIWGQTFVCLNSTPLMTDVTSKASNSACRARAIPSPCWKSKRAMQREGNLTTWLRPLHRTPHKGEVEPFVWQRGGASSPPLCLAIRATRSRTKFHSDNFVPLAQGGLPITRSYRPHVLVTNGGPQASKTLAFLFTLQQDPMKHRSAQVLKPQLVYWSGVGVEFDRQQVKAQRRELESSLVNVEARQLAVQDPPKHGRVRSHPVRSPMLRDQFTKGGQKEYSPAHCRVENSRRLRNSFPRKRSERRSDHEFRNRLRCVIASLSLLFLRRVVLQIELVRLAQNTNWDVREIQVAPLLLPTKVKLATGAFRRMFPNTP